MKTVFIFRHGKSDWEATYSDDFDRPLAKRGRKAAKQMGRFLKKINQVPDCAVASPALRTKSTLERAMAFGEWEHVDVWFDPILYEGGWQEYQEVLMQAPESAESIMVVGHEPNCSALFEALLGRAEVRFPTAAMARIDFETEHWQELQYGKGTLIWFILPRLL